MRSGLASYEIASIRTNLDETHPVYVRANDISEGGHAWIADGYIYSRIGTEYYEEILIDNGLTLYYDYILTNSTVQTIWSIIIGAGMAVVMAILLLEMGSLLAMDISSMDCR